MAAVAGCSQCGKPAIVAVNNLPLCVDCWSKVDEIRSRNMREAAAMLNYMEQHMADITGIPHLARRMEMPQPSAIVHRSTPMTFNNINVTNSQVGVLNTGEVQRIDATVTQLHKMGGDQVGNALKQVTQAVLDDPSLNDTQKNELIEQISYLSGQVVAKSSERRPGMIKAAMSAITMAAQTATALAAAWQTAQPILTQIFGP